MTFQSTNFEVDCIGINEWLGLPNDVYADIFKITAYKSVINWSAHIEERSYGIINVTSVIDDINLNLGFSYRTDEVSERATEDICEKYNCDVSPYWVKGEFLPKMFNKFIVDSEIELKNGTMFITDILIDFFDKKIVIR